MMWTGGMGAGGWLLMALLMVAFWVAVAVAIVWVVRTTRRPGAGVGTVAPPDARQILDVRLASGDLTEDEYRSRRTLLSP